MLSVPNIFEIGSSIRSPCKRSWYPPFAQNAKNGAPNMLAMQARSEAWATRQRLTLSTASLFLDNLKVRNDSRAADH